MPSSIDHLMRNPTPQSAARSPARLLGDRNFGPFYFGKLISHTGLWVQNITAAILVYELTESAIAVGGVSIFQFAPQMLLALWMGAVSDRTDRKRLLIIGRSISATASAGIALLLGFVGVDGLPGVWPVYLAALIAGIGFSISAPPMNALVPNLVPKRDLFSAIALNSSTGNIARAIGPAVGAALYVSVGPAVSFGMAAGGHVTFICALLLIAHRRNPAESRDTSVRGGLRYLRGSPLMVVLLICVWGIGFASDAVITLTPPLAEALGSGEVLVGVLASMFGLGALLALASTGPWQKRMGLTNSGVAGFAITAFGFALLAVAPGVPLALAAMTFAGYGFLLANSALTSRIQLLVPETLRGRVMSIWAFGFLGSRPIAALVNGSVADTVGVRAAIFLSVLVSVAAGLLAYFKAAESEEERIRVAESNESSG